MESINIEILLYSIPSYPGQQFRVQRQAPEISTSIVVRSPGDLLILVPAHGGPDTARQPTEPARRGAVLGPATAAPSASGSRPDRRQRQPPVAQPRAALARCSLMDIRLVEITDDELHRRVTDQGRGQQPRQAREASTGGRLFGVAGPACSDAHRLPAVARGTVDNTGELRRQAGGHLVERGERALQRRGPRRLDPIELSTPAAAGRHAVADLGAYKRSRGVS